MKDKGLDWVWEEVSHWVWLERRTTEKWHKKGNFLFSNYAFYLLTMLQMWTLNAYILLPGPPWPVIWKTSKSWFYNTMAFPRLQELVLHGPKIRWENAQHVENIKMLNKWVWHLTEFKCPVCIIYHLSWEKVAGVLSTGYTNSNKKSHFFQGAYGFMYG